MTTEYRVQLAAFEGPLDLLLHLIRKHEVDIHDIPISTVTDQYIEHLQDIERIDIDLAGEFLVMAATLMEVKSRMLIPPSEQAGTQEGSSEEDIVGVVDPRSELVQQLLEYKRYRDAADALDHRRKDWSQRAPSAPAGIDNETLRNALGNADDLDLEDLNLVDLCEAFEQICAAVDMTRLGDHEVVLDDTPIELHAEDLIDRLRRESKPMTLQAAFEGRNRGEMLGLFLAMLELLRQQRMIARQDDETGQIWIEVCGDGTQDSSFGIGDSDSDAPEDDAPNEPGHE